MKWMNKNLPNCKIRFLKKKVSWQSYTFSESGFQNGFWAMFRGRRVVLAAAPKTVMPKERKCT